MAEAKSRFIKITQPQEAQICTLVSSSTGLNPSIGAIKHLNQVTRKETGLNLPCVVILATKQLKILHAMRNQHCRSSKVTMWQLAP